MPHGDIRLDPMTREVSLGGKLVYLTPKEFSLLDVFVSNPNKILSRAYLVKSAWNCDYDLLTNSIDVYVCFLRKKIRSATEMKLIHTVRWAGYVLREE
jgi:two-component system response regulator MprA